jgi:hypothetical protein
MSQGANPRLGECLDKYNAVEAAIHFGSCEGLSLLLSQIPTDKINDGCSGAPWLAASQGRDGEDETPGFGWRRP